MKEQTEVRNLKEGRYVIIDDEVCVIKSISKSKPGKHGSAKARVDTIGLFDKQKRSLVQPVSAKIFVPIVERKSAQVLSISGNVAQLMDMAEYSTLELPIPDEYKDRVVEGSEIQYITALGKMRIDMR
ncbi:MAG: translation initiation factor IF-5A [Euryarchaeota archaeon]|nr:MAG: Translation initiation factor 5A [ANME-2 cluster archaeon]MEA1865239.1 translation initiation factor IF-5A [Euryarchaeota archaeon]